MRFCLPRQLHTTRLAALALALVCLWMGTAGALGHTEHWRAGHSSSPVASLRQAQPAAAPDPCAACAWAAGLVSVGVAAFALACPLSAFTPRPDPAPRSVFTPTLTHSGSRAPPALVS